MKSNLTPVLSTFFLIGLSVAPSQDLDLDRQSENPLAEAFHEFGLREWWGPTGAAFVLEENFRSPAPPPGPADDGSHLAGIESDPEEDVSAVPSDALREPMEAAREADEAADFAPGLATGLAIRVETVRRGQGSAGPVQTELHAPFPAKPMSAPPPGWRLVSPDLAPEISREVELSPGNRITLSVRPHLLAPEVDGASTFGIPEPGFDHALGYHQTQTVGAVLASSIGSLEDDSQKLGRAIERLQQLLVSLPKPPPEFSEP